MYLKRKIILVVLVLSLIFSMAALSFAAYPDKNITNIIPYKPGGGSDVLSQLIQPFLEKYLGTTIVNVYKPGASAAVGLTYLVKETEADGYTIGMGSTPSLFGNPIKYPDTVKYTMNDLIPLYNIVDDPGVVVVNRKSPFNTLEDLISYAKEHPKTVTMAVSGVGSDDWIAIKFLQKYADIKVIPVPFGGSGPAWQAALGGHVTVCFGNIGTLISKIKDGSFKALAVLTEERWPDLPNVPTAMELGYRILSSSARGYLLKAGTPTEMVKVLEAAFEKALKDPEFIEKAKTAGIPLAPMNSQKYSKYLQERAKDYKTIWDEFGE